MTSQFIFTYEPIENNDSYIRHAEFLVDSQTMFYNHQMFIMRFLSPWTPYKKMLIFHEMGTGKTCTAIGTAELALKFYPALGKILVITQNEQITNNFLKEIGKCTNDKYLGKKVVQTNKNIKEVYEFTTKFKLADEVKHAGEAEIRAKYANIGFIIIDEAHNIKLTKDGTWNYIFDFLHFFPDVKTILMTGTPMSDDSMEIASLMNLILPLDKQLPLESRFETAAELDLLRRTLYGYVSFFRRPRDSRFKRKFQGRTKLNDFMIYEDMMSAFQSSHYADMNSPESGEFYNNSSYSSLAIFPDGTYNKRDSNKYYSGTITEKNFPKLLDPKLFTMELLYNVSIKYYDIINRINESIKMADEHKFLIYIDVVNGVGCVYFCLLLQHFTKLLRVTKDNMRSPVLKYAFLSSTTANLNKEAITMNNKGEGNIKVIIISDAYSEGVSLLGIKNIHILSPNWNFSTIDQAIARVRTKPGMNVNINVFLHCAIPKGAAHSIDLHKYKTSIEKDIRIKRVERVLKEAAVDCPINYQKTRGYIEQSRDCDYQTCAYDCVTPMALYEEMRANNFQNADKSAFLMFYALETGAQEKVEMYFRYNWYGMIEDVVTISGLLYDQVALILSKFIYTGQLLLTPLKTKMYLLQNNDIYFLSPNTENNIGNLPEIITSYTMITNNNIPRRSAKSRGNDVLAWINNPSSIKFEHIDDYYKEMILEAAALMNREDIISMFGNERVKRDGKKIESSISGIERKFDGEKWG